MSNKKSLLGITLLTTTLTGCMAANPTYMGGTMATVSQAELQSSPQFTDEELQQRHNTLSKSFEEFRSAPDSHFDTTDATDCELNTAGQWMVTHGRSEAEIKAIQARHDEQFEMKQNTRMESVKLLEGKCVDGMPEGPFVGIGRYTQTVTTDASSSTTKASVRTEATANGGALEGEALFLTRQSMASAYNGQTANVQTLTATSGPFEAGVESGRHLILTANPAANTTTTLVRTNQQTAMGPQVQVDTYLGSRLTSSTNMLNDVTHGWMTNYLLPEGQRRTCFRYGEMADDGACAGMAMPTIATKPVSDDVLEKMVRRDNQGEFMSPYTSDGVLAEWVNIGTNASIGGTVGSGVGAAAGSMVADQVLDSVPFAGLIGGIIGSQMGKDAGREAAISASGGWETIRDSSDMSFNSLQDMAVYLTQKYGREPTYGDAMQVTLQVYPELEGALASAY